MKGNSENIDNFFRSKMDSYGEIPEAAVWEGISEKLGHNKKKKLIIFMSKVAAGMLLVVSLGLGYYLLNKKSSLDYVESIELTREPEYNKTVTETDKTMAATDKTVAASDETIKATDNTVAASDKTIKTTDNTVAASDKTIKATDNTITVSDKPMAAIDKTITVSDKPMAATNKTDGFESEEILESRYSEEADIAEKEYTEKSEQSGLAEKYEEVPDSEISLVQKEIAGEGESEIIIASEFEQQDNEKSRDVISRLQSKYLSKLDNSNSGDLLLAERHNEKPAEANIEFSDYGEEYNIDDTQDKSWENQWAVGGQLAPLYSYRNFASDYLSDYVKDQINSNESGVIAYAMGVNVAVTPGKRLSIQSGIYYSKYGQHTDVLNITSNNPEPSSWDQPEEEYGTSSILFSNSTGTVATSRGDQLSFIGTYNSGLNDKRDLMSNQLNTSDINSNSTATQYFEYLEIPIVIKYKLIDRKIDLNILGGLSTNFLIGNDIYLDEGDGDHKYGETINISSTNYSSSIGMGLEYPVLSNFIVNVEPKFKYYLNPIDKKPSYNIHPYSIGIFTGISYIF